MNAIGQTPDGRIWEYLYATEAIAQYLVASNPANTEVDTLSSAASSQDAAKYTFITEGSAGWTVGAYQDHWVVVDDGTGEGQLGKIKDNTKDTLELYFDHAFTTALDVTDSDITIRHEPDAELVAITATGTALKGVAQVAFAAYDYGWFLKRGIGGVVGGAAMTINMPCSPGGATEGYALVVAAGAHLEDYSVVGRVLVANTTAAKATLVDINIW